MSDVRPPHPKVLAARRLAFSVARGFLTRREVLDFLNPDEFPTGSALRCRIIWELDDNTHAIAGRAAKAHAIIRFKTREAIRAGKRSAAIKAEADLIQDQFSDVLVAGEARAIAFEAMNAFLGAQREPIDANRGHDASAGPIPPTIPPKSPFTSKINTKTADSAETRCENTQEGENAP